MKIFALTFILAFLCSCSAEHISSSGAAGGSYTLNPNPNPALKTAAEDILGPRCANCHGASSGVSTSFLNTAADPDLDTLAQNQTFVSIGRGSSSLLYLRSSDGSMPPGNPLSQSESDAIKAWIDDLGVFNPGTGGGGTGTGPTFSNIESEILAPKCYNCHRTSSTRPFSSYDDIMYGYVAAYNLDSILYLSITDGSTLGGLMPQGSSLSASEIKLIEDWIMSGAPNN